MAITTAGSSNFTEMINPIIPLNLMGGRATFKDFIGVWEGFMPAPVCSDLISYFQQWKQQATIKGEDSDLQFTDFAEGANEGMSGTGQFANRELGRKDLSIMLDSMSSQMSNMVNQYLQSCVNHYCTEYGALATTPITSWNIKMQETEAGGGYHVYHYEKGSFSEAGRELVWMIYLNEEFDGGETEFLYQKRRIKPTTGTVVIWPAGFTHTHKGNLVLEGTKYVVTGWYYKQPV